MKKVVLSFLSVLLSLSLAGCWNQREIGKIAIVMGFAVDNGESEDEIEITAQIANTRTITAASEGGGGEEKPYLNLSSRGEYVFPSIRTSVTKSGAELYMAHNYVVIFGQEIAKKGLGSYMDFFLRDHELRLDMHLLISRTRGADILGTETGFQSIPALHIHDLIRAQKQLSTGMPITVLDFMNRLAADRAAPLIPIIEVEKNDEEDVLHMAGTAVFSDDVMVGDLDPRETRGYLWAAGDVKEAVVVCTAGDDHVGIEVLHAAGSITPAIHENGELSMRIAVSAKGSIGSERGRRDFTSSEGVEKLLAAFAGEIEGEIRACLEKGKALRADIFGFSDVLYKKHPRLWEKMKDSPFYDLPVEIEVKTNLDSSGRISVPLR